MKKFFTAVMIVLSIVSVPLGAVSWKAEGTGSTYEEAVENAHSALMQSICGFSVSVSSSLSVRDDGSSASSDMFEENVSSFSYGKLLGVEDTTVSSRKGWTVSSEIDSSALPLYLSELSKLSRDINVAYAAESTRRDEKENRYLNLMDLLVRYESAVHVASVLGADRDDIPLLKADITFNSIQNEYMGYLVDSENRWQDELSAIRDSQSAEFRDLKDRISENRMMQDRINREARETRTEQDSMERKRVMENLARMNAALAESSVKVEGKDFSGYFDSLQSQGRNLEAFRSRYTNMLKSERARIERESGAEVLSMRRIPFKASEISDGKPILLALLMRESSIDEIKERYRLQEEEIIDMIHESMYPTLVDSCRTIKEFAEEIDRTEFTAMGDGDALSYEFDGSRAVWNFSMPFTIGNASVTVKWSEPYETVTGLEPVLAKGGSASALFNAMKKDPELRARKMEYDEYVQDYNSRFMEGKCSASVSFRVTVAEDGTGRIGLRGLSIDLLDGRGSRDIKSFTSEVKGELSLPVIRKLTDNEVFLKDPGFNL